MTGNNKNISQMQNEGKKKTIADSTVAMVFKVTDSPGGKDFLFLSEI